MKLRGVGGQYAGFQTSIAGASTCSPRMSTNLTPCTCERASDQGTTDTPSPLATVATLVSHWRAAWARRGWIAAREQMAIRRGIDKCLHGYGHAAVR